MSPKGWQDVFLTDAEGAGQPTTEAVGAEDDSSGRSGFFKRLRESMAATHLALAGELRATLGESLNDESWERLEEALINADVGVPATAQLVGTLESQYRDGVIATTDELFDHLRIAIAAELRVGDDKIDIAHRPSVILTVGVNGTGKTTTVGKIAWHLAHELGRSVIIAAADTYRAAAEEQLTVWAKRAGCEIVRADPGTDPGAVVYDAIEAARARGHDVVIADTAGRLHTHGGLMEELAKVRRVIQRQIEGAPHETLLIVDATTGQNGLRQAQMFKQVVGVSGVCLTKLDGSAKGGIAVAVARELGIPVKLIGIGEGIEDLRPFDADDFARALVE